MDQDDCHYIYSLYYHSMTTQDKVSVNLKWHVFSLYNGRDDEYSYMQCPNCSAQMQLMQRYEVDIDYCPACKGVWLDRGEIDKIAKIQRSYEDQHYNKYHFREGGYDDYYDDYYNDNRSRNRGFFGSLFDY